MRKYIYRFLAIAIFITISFALSAQSTDDALRAQGFSLAERKLDPPPIELKDLQGTIHTLDDHKGKLVILNFWATWCPPCRAEMPSMQAMYEEFNSQGLELLAVDVREPEGTVRKFIQENGYTFPILLDETGITGAQYGARSIPTTYLIGRDGKIFARIIGSKEWDTPGMRSLIEDLLANG